MFKSIMKSEIISFEDQHFFLSPPLQNIDDNFFNTLGKFAKSFEKKKKKLSIKMSINLLTIIKIEQLELLVVIICYHMLNLFIAKK